MLDSFRVASRHWTIKLLFALLIGSFVLWGFGDMVRVWAFQKPAIKVGKREISSQEVQSAFQRGVERLQGRLTVEQARAFGLMDQTVQSLVSQAVLDQSADRIGLYVSDNAVRETIRSLPAFQNQLKMFDKELFDARLRQAGYTEQRFIALERDELRRDKILHLLQSGGGVPMPVVKLLFGYFGESRAVEVLEFSPERQPVPHAPAENVLEEYQKAHADTFKTPERRTATALLLRESDLITNFKPEETAVQAAYDSRKAEFTLPEKRTLAQAVIPDETKAKAILAAIKGGQAFDAAVTAAGASVLDMGTVTQAEIPIKELSDAAFALPAAGPVGPVKSPLGWHVLHVSAIQPGQAKSLNEVRTQLVAGLAQDAAAKAFYDKINQLEDSIGAGSSLDDAAKSLGVTVRTLPALDRQGRDADGKTVADVPADLLKVLFGATVGTQSEVVQSADHRSAFVVRLDQIDPVADQTFAKVKPAVLAAWIVEQQSAAARKKADEALAKLQSGATLASLSASAGQPVKTPAPFLRNAGQDPALGETVVQASFGLAKVGDAVIAQRGETPVLVRLTGMTAADPEKYRSELDQIREQLRQEYSNDILEQFVAAMSREIGVTINRARIDQQ